MSERDVFFNDTSARMATFNALARYHQRMTLTVGILDSLIDEVYRRYKEHDDDESLESFVANKPVDDWARDLEAAHDHT